MSGGRTPRRSPEAPATGGGAGAARAGGPSRERRAEGPRRVRNGVKLRARDGRVERTAISGPWLDRVESIFADAEREEGLRYARLGQTRAFDVEPGRIGGTVQGRAAAPYATEIRFAPYDEEAWETIVAAMAREAIYLVKLMAGELPDGVDDLLREQGLRLLPGTDDEVRIQCSCSRPKPCCHAAALGFLFGERLADTPLTVLTVRGLPADRLLERLRQMRHLQAHGVASAHVDPMIPQSSVEPAPLESLVEEFWRPRPEFARLLELPPPRHVPHALLRRLGPSPLQGRFPLVGLLASIYDHVTAYAVGLRDRAERLGEE